MSVRRATGSISAETAILNGRYIRPRALTSKLENPSPKPPGPAKMSTTPIPAFPNMREGLLSSGPRVIRPSDHVLDRPLSSTISYAARAGRRRKRQLVRLDPDAEQSTELRSRPSYLDTESRIQQKCPRPLGSDKRPRLASFSMPMLEA